MAKLIAFFLGVFFFGTVFSGIAANGGGVLSTRLTTAMDATTNIVRVSSTTNFMDTDYITIDNEQMLYSSINATAFLGVTRGVNNTTAAVHSLTTSTGLTTRVYNQESSLINSFMNVNITAVATNSGWFTVLLVPWYFLRQLPNLVTMNFPFLQGDMALVGYLFVICAIGLLITFAMSMLWVAAGVIKIL
ncbi:MAG: hypothetical protein WC822_06145 [Candidatus Paceibacterota bacterium]|jgi:hypothetical protein